MDRKALREPVDMNRLRDLIAETAKEGVTVPTVLSGDEDLLAYVDSLGVIELSMTLETIIHAPIPDAVLEGWKTPKDVLAGLAQIETV